MKKASNRIITRVMILPLASLAIIIALPLASCKNARTEATPASGIATPETIFFRPEPIYQKDYARSFIRLTELNDEREAEFDSAMAKAEGKDYENPSAQIVITERVLEHSPLPELYFHLGNLHYFAKDYRSASISFLLAAYNGYRKGYFALYNAASCFSLLGNDARALSCLRFALGMGYRDEKLLASDPDLERLRGTEAFRALVEADPDTLVEEFLAACRIQHVNVSWLEGGYLGGFEFREGSSPSGFKLRRLFSYPTDEPLPEDSTIIEGAVMRTEAKGIEMRLSARNGKIAAEITRISSGIEDRNRAYVPLRDESGSFARLPLDSCPLEFGPRPLYAIIDSYDDWTPPELPQKDRKEGYSFTVFGIGYGDWPGGSAGAEPSSLPEYLPDYWDRYGLEITAWPFD